MKRHLFCANGSEFADLAFSNIVATFCQYLSPIISKVLTQDKKNEIYGRPLGKTYPGITLTDPLVPGALCWWAGLATIDQLLTISLVLVNIGEKITLGLKYT